MDEEYKPRIDQFANGRPIPKGETTTPLERSRMDDMKWTQDTLLMLGIKLGIKSFRDAGMRGRKP